LNKDYWLVVGVVALGLYLYLNKRAKVSSFNGKEETYAMSKYGKETLLINL